MYSALDSCRICSSGDILPILDLGTQCLTGVFPKSESEEVAAGPLELVKCANCDLVQLAHNYDLSLLYGENYGYRSGLNLSMVRHLHGKVARILELVKVDPDDLIIDIGSNDSTLLQAYPDKQLRLMGVDPSGPKFKKYYPPHIELIPEFFSGEAVEKFAGSQKAKVITSIAMFYDLEEPQKFVQEIRGALEVDGVWVFEQSYLPLMLDATAYDTVCHEHLEYYSLKQIKYMTDRAGLKIVDIEINDVNGGSFSITAARKDSDYPEARDQIGRIVADEERRGLNTMKPYAEFRQRTQTHRDDLLQALAAIRREGKKLLGYGASTKGNVLLQYCGLGREEIPCIAEVNEDKFGAFTPGTRIPIISEAEAKKMNPDHFLVLPWHFKKGILEREQSFLRSGGKLLFPLPEIEIVAQ